MKNLRLIESAVPFTIKEQEVKIRFFSDSIVPIRAWHLARLRSSANFSTLFVSEKLNRFKLCLETRPDVSKCLGIGSSSNGVQKNRPTQMIPKLSGQIFRIISQFGKILVSCFYLVETYSQKNNGLGLDLRPTCPKAS